MKKGTLWLLSLIALSSCNSKNEPAELQPVTVHSVAVGMAGVDGSRSYSGTIEEESGTSLSFSALGTVGSINVSEGQFVARGQLIGTVDATSARNAYDAALAAREQAQDAERRMKLLHDNGSLPEVKWVEVQTQVRQAVASEQIARKGLNDTRLYAPFAGYIAQKMVDAGANVGPGVPVVRLVKIGRVKASFSVPEGEVAAVAVGQTVSVRVEALGQRLFTGRVVERGVTADPLSRTYEVKAIIDNPRQELLPGMIAQVSLAAARADTAAIVLPARAVLLDFDNRRFVWTVQGDTARKVYVSTGDNTASGLVVTGGLRPGDRVIVEGQQKVSTGMRVKEVP